MGKWTSALLVIALSAAATPLLAQDRPASLVISDPVAEEQNLRTLSIDDPNSGATFRVVYDASSEGVARDSIPVLAWFYAQISDLVAVDASTVDWSDVLFARNAEDLLLTRKAGQRWKPQLEQHERERLAQALASSAEPLALSSWGGVQPKIEAILRQLTPEQRAQFLEDPTSVPLRAMSFGPDDLVSDESNTLARYAGSLAVFEQIEKRAGREAMQAWFRAARDPDVSGTRQLVELARELTGTDIAADLR